MTFATEPATSSTLRLAHHAKSAFEVVERWCDETHGTSFWVCMEQPCHAVNRLIDDGGDQP